MTEVADVLRELDGVTKRLNKIEGERKQLLERAKELAVSALKAEVPPTEVARRSPYSAAHLRTLARVNGIPPARRGQGSPTTGDTDPTR